MDYKEYADLVAGQKKRLGITNDDLRLPLQRFSPTTISRLLNDPAKLTLEQFGELNRALRIKSQITLKA